MVSQVVLLETLKQCAAAAILMRGVVGEIVHDVTDAEARKRRCAGRAKSEP